MKNIALLMSIILVSNCFAGKHKIKKAERAKLLNLKETVICKKLVQNPQTGILSFVDTETAGQGTQIPLVLINKSRIDWNYIIASLNMPKGSSLDPEIELMKNS